MGGTLIPVAKAETIYAKAALATSGNGGEILRQPGTITAFAGLDSPISLSLQGHAWSGKDVFVELDMHPSGSEQTIRLTSPSTALSHLHLRWKASFPDGLRCLGDAWERSYGDLEWRGIVPERVMPWYVLTYDGRVLRGFGVKTQPGAFCFWQLDREGISLWVDVRNGGLPIQLGQRQLAVATLVSRTGDPGETTFEAARAFCRRMCDSPRLPKETLFGSNDWYYAYGQNTADGILRDADLMARVAPAEGPRPFVVIDDGWQDKKRFPDLKDLAGRIRGRGLRPGIWIRPLRAPADANPSHLLPDARFGPDVHHANLAWDPTIPEAMERVLESVRQPLSEGYELLKHDFSTWELLGRWGFSMGPLPTSGAWQFADRTRTTAEIILKFYQSLRNAAGEETLLIGCNTMGHLSAGIFESSRTGDDTSGTDWERTRRMGVNTLGLRLPQHRTFFHADPDCVALTPKVEWNKTRQWLDVVARSGTALFISPEPEAVGPDQVAALKDAFLAARASSGFAEDWIETSSPERWQFEPGGKEPTHYDWSGMTGASPFSIA